MFDIKTFKKSVNCLIPWHFFWPNKTFANDVMFAKLGLLVFV